jgi:hypothetical protein
MKKYQELYMKEYSLIFVPEYYSLKRMGKQLVPLFIIYFS